jgi:hypothetical protein
VHLSDRTQRTLCRQLSSTVCNHTAAREVGTSRSVGDPAVGHRKSRTTQPFCLTLLGESSTADEGSEAQDDPNDKCPVVSAGLFSFWKKRQTCFIAQQARSVRRDRHDCRKRQELKRCQPGRIAKSLYGTKQTPPSCGSHGGRQKWWLDGPKSVHRRTFDQRGAPQRRCWNSISSSFWSPQATASEGQRN